MHVKLLVIKAYIWTCCFSWYMIVINYYMVEEIVKLIRLNLLII